MTVENFLKLKRLFIDIDVSFDIILKDGTKLEYFFSGSDFPNNITFNDDDKIISHLDIKLDKDHKRNYIVSFSQYSYNDISKIEFYSNRFNKRNSSTELIHMIHNTGVIKDHELVEFLNYCEKLHIL